MCVCVCVRAWCFESEGLRSSTRLRGVERQEQEAVLSAKFRQGSALDALRIDLEVRRVRDLDLEL